LNLKEIDLRSDTITKPDKGMLDAMFSAEVGDDVWGEDPTVKSLESKLANMFSKEAALFCPSGTMTNQIAIRVHTRLGDEIICDKLAHIYNYEGGGISSNSGVSVKLINGDHGRISVDQIQRNINPDDPHFAKTKLICVENTVNKGGGACYNYTDLRSISNFCKKNKLLFHLDGARIFNALVEQSHSSKEYGALFDSISVCLSKGLGAPIGSVLIGSKEFIKEAIRVRKSFGGGMRQVGYLAAAGQYAIENNINRLREDHMRAKQIAEILSKMSYVQNVRPVNTNIILFDICNIDLPTFNRFLSENNIKASFMGEKTVRFVTHMQFLDEHMDSLINVLRHQIK